jgi:hypothetical protein
LTLPGNTWGQELKERGFPIKWIEDGQRIVPYATREEMTLNADGSFGAVDARIYAADDVYRAGIRKTKRRFC